MNRLSKILIIPLLIVMIFAFGMGASAEIHSKWVAGDLIFYDATQDILTIKDDTGGLIVGETTAGVDFKAWSDTASTYLLWDADADDLLLVGTATKLNVAGTTEATASTGAIYTDGGICAKKKVYVGTNLVLVAGPLDVSSAAIDIKVKSNTDSALEFVINSTAFIDIDTRNSVTDITNVMFTAIASEIASGTNIWKRTVGITPGTTTLTGTTTCDNMSGLALYIAQPTVTSGETVTVTKASTVYIVAEPVGSSVTIAAAYALEIASGDFLTAGKIIVDDTTTGAASAGSIQTDGGLSVALKAYISGGVFIVANVAATTFLDFEIGTSWSSGTLINADFGAPTTLDGAVTLLNLDCANVNAASEQNVIGIDLNLPQLTITNNTVDVKGIEITAQGAMALTVGGDATWVGIDIATPAISQDVGSVTSTGVNVVGGTLTSGTAYGLTLSGAFTTGIDMTGTYATAAINIATISDGVIATISSATSATNALYGRIVADAEWTGNLVGVRGKVEIGSIVDITSATGVWAGIAITGPSIQRHGLVCAINAEVSSTTVNMPNAILYLQSLPSGSAADFSNVPYITFSETISAGTGSNILFEVGSKYANLMPTIGTGELFYNDTLQIAVNESAGVRTAFFIPLSNAEGTYSVGTMANATGSGQTITDSYNKMLQIYCDATADGSTVGQAANELYVGEVRQLLTGTPFQGEQYAWKATQRYYGTPAISSYSAAIHGKLESAGTLDVNGQVGCFQAHISDVQAGTFDIDAGGNLYGFHAIGNFGNAHDGTGTSAAYMTNVVAAHNWDVGLLLLDDSTDTGIDIGTTSVAGIDVSAGGVLGIDFNGTFTGNVIQIGDASTALTTATEGLVGIYVNYEYSKAAGTGGSVLGGQFKSYYIGTGTDYGSVNGIQAIAGIKSGATLGGSGGSWNCGISGVFDVAGTINNANAFGCGVKATLMGAGTFTAASHVAALWVDNVAQKDMTSGMESSLVYLTNNGLTASQLDAIWYIRGADIDYFWIFGTGTAGPWWSAGGSDCNASGATDPVGTIKIKDANGADAYIRIWAAP